MQQTWWVGKPLDQHCWAEHPPWRERKLINVLPQNQLLSNFDPGCCHYKISSIQQGWWIQYLVNSWRREFAHFLTLEREERSSCHTLVPEPTCYQPASLLPGFLISARFVLKLCLNDLSGSLCTLFNVPAVKYQFDEMVIVIIWDEKAWSALSVYHVIFGSCRANEPQPPEPKGLWQLQALQKSQSPLISYRVFF